MKNYLLIVFTALSLVILGTLFSACGSTGAGGSNGTAGAGMDPMATVAVLDPPASGVRLPEIAETISHTLSYSISDAYFTPGNTYRITGYFRATDSLIQVYQTTVSEQTAGSVAVSFDIPAGFPVTSTTVVPYRLFYQLTDETNGILVLDDSPDLVYEDWVFTGTWYGIDSRSEITNMSFQTSVYDTDSGGYENGRKGPLENRSGNSAHITFTHIWEESFWDEPSNPEAGTIYYALDGNTMTFAGNAAMTDIFQLLSTEPTMYGEDYAGKWWTDEVKKEVGDNGIILYMSDSEFEVLRDEQNEYPLVERGTISASGTTLILTVTHLPSGTPGFFTPVDPSDPVVEYTMNYSYSADDDELTLTGTVGGDYADADGISYRD